MQIHRISDIIYVSFTNALPTITAIIVQEAKVMYTLQCKRRKFMISISVRGKKRVLFIIINK
jgi:hypothetical protein